MKIEVILDEGEDVYNAMNFASAVVDFHMEAVQGIPTLTRWKRKMLGEVAKHLQVFCDFHPVEECGEEI